MSSRARGPRNREIKVLQAEKPLLVRKKNKSGGTKPNQPKIIPSPLKKGTKLKGPKISTSPLHKGTKSEESKLSAAPSPSGDNICHVYKYWPRIRDGKAVEPEIYTVSVPAELDMVKLVIAPFPRVKRPDSDFVDDGSDVEPLLSLPEFGDFPTSSPDIFYGPR
ncbi:uncharacterized protein LOC133710366 isoform X2 [Rosa rugosa]|uniref:uncharacterized protein LOC133710366 isoform X2 n=1 Tax=Rosa rugosa TaxID=74645 RepID=UPI002B4065A1|nr:uncharacterized protein LOC133710366 isoform X2 [Rosa rugosa]